jgi:hypothetical protein
MNEIQVLKKDNPSKFKMHKSYAAMQYIFNKYSYVASSSNNFPCVAILALIPATSL